QCHESASGHRQFRCRPAEHAEILLTRRNTQALERLQELLSGRLLAYAHALRRVLRLALQVVDCSEPAGEQRLNSLGLLVENACTHRQKVDNLAWYPGA